MSAFDKADMRGPMDRRIACWHSCFCYRNFWLEEKSTVKQSSVVCRTSGELRRQRSVGTPRARLYLPFPGGTLMELWKNSSARSTSIQISAAHGYLAFALAVDGRSEQAIAHSEQAIHMSHMTHKTRYSTCA